MCALLLLACAATAARPAVLKIPAVEGPLTIDGVPDEAAWQNAARLPGPALGGDIRVLARRGYLCFSARLPESGRLVAHATGGNAAWWREDAVSWTVRFKAFNTSVTITVNPLGAWRAAYTGQAGELPPNSVLAAAMAGPGWWGAEAAIPLKAGAGFLSARRVRPARPDMPEIQWTWPARNESLWFEVPGAPGVGNPPALDRRAWWADSSPPMPAPAEGRVAAALAAVPRTLLPPSGAGRMWENEIRGRVTAAAAAERLAWEHVRTVADWEQFRDVRLRALRTSLGSFPERTPLHAVVTSRRDYGDGFVLENVIFESRPGLVVAANLYLPSRIAGRIPAVIVVHSHHAPKTQWELQDLGMTWARSGVAVFIMDQLGAGERLQTQPWPRESYYSRYALGAQLYLAGESLMKWMVWDLMRGIDLLLERPYIDSSRVVMLGAVAGGGDPAAVAATLDRRIAALIPFNFGEAGPEEHYTIGPRPSDAATADPGWGEWESTRCLRQSIAGQFFPWFLCAAGAPRPLVFSFEIGWPHGVENEPAWARYQKVYDLYGRRDRLDQVDGFGPFPGPGEVTDIGVHLRTKLYPILNRWLNLPMPAEEYHDPRPDAELMCLTRQAAVERKPKTVSQVVYSLAQSRLAAAQAARPDLRPALQSLLGSIEPPSHPAARSLWSRTYAGFAVEAVAVNSAPGITVPLLLIKPERAVRPAVVVALAQGGKAAFLAHRRTDIAAFLDRGVALCLADVRGTGETAPGSRDALAATELMLGDTALGARLKDARAVVRYLGRRADLDGARLAFWGDAFEPVNPPSPLLDQSLRQQPGPQVLRQADPLGGVLALLTGLYEPAVRAVAARGSLVSYLSALQDRFCYLPQDVMVPGILGIADLPDIAAALAPRPVLQVAPVDARNRPVSQSTATRDLPNWLCDALHR